MTTKARFTKCTKNVKHRPSDIHINDYYSSKGKRLRVFMAQSGFYHDYQEGSDFSHETQSHEKSPFLLTCESEQRRH